MADRPRPPKRDIPFANDFEIAELVDKFERCRWPINRWTHRAHIAVAVHYLRRRPFDEALTRIRDNIQRYNRTCGDPDGYHETITIVFMRLIADRLRAGLGDRTEAAFVDELCRDHAMPWLMTYYSPERLWSAEAVSAWVEPDRKPLDF